MKRGKFIFIISIIAAIILLIAAFSLTKLALSQAKPQQESISAEK